MPLPGDTLDETLPKLTSLRDNGGPTPTHALRGDAPALNRGNNLLDEDFDQRGSGFPRSSGSGVDIGAYELDAGDLIFADDFDDLLL